MRDWGTESLRSCQRSQSLKVAVQTQAQADSRAAESCGHACVCPSLRTHTDTPSSALPSPASFAHWGLSALQLRLLCLLAPLPRYRTSLSSMMTSYGIFSFLNGSPATHKWEMLDWESVAFASLICWVLARPLPRSRFVTSMQSVHLSGPQFLQL